MLKYISTKTATCQQILTHLQYGCIKFIQKSVLRFSSCLMRTDTVKKKQPLCDLLLQPRPYVPPASALKEYILSTLCIFVFSTVLKYTKILYKKKTIKRGFTYIPNILILSKFFYSPTDAQVNFLKNNFKIYIKIYIKTAPMYFNWLF